jgi:hypothetical protein
MNTEDYGKMVHCLFKDANDIMRTLTPEQLNLLHCTMGLAGEAAEVMDLVKKSVMTGTPFNFEKVIKEMGDTEFYMEATRQALGVTRDRVLLGNMEKLSGTGGRYENGYSDAACAARVDKEQDNEC